MNLGTLLDLLERFDKPLLALAHLACPLWVFVDDPHLRVVLPHWQSPSPALVAQLALLLVSELLQVLGHPGAILLHHRHALLGFPVTHHQSIFEPRHHSLPRFVSIPTLLTTRGYKYQLPWYIPRMEAPANHESEPAIALVRAGKADMPAYMEIERSVAGQRIYSAMLTEEEVEAEFEKVVVYMIKRGDEVIGSASYEIKNPDHAYIDGLAIKPEHQGRGAGTLAMRKMLEELQGYKVVDLVTHPENSRAIALYQSLGFELGERIENYFNDGEPRVRMTLIKS